LNKHHSFKDFNNIYVDLSQLGTVPRVSELSFITWADHLILRLIFFLGNYNI